MGATVGTEEGGIYQSFLGLLNYSKNFYLGWCCFQHIPPNQIHFQQVSKTISNQVPQQKFCKVLSLNETSNLLTLKDIFI